MKRAANIVIIGVHESTVAELVGSFPKDELSYPNKEGLAGKTCREEKQRKIEGNMEQMVQWEKLYNKIKEHG